jgi:hypothetical protein
MHLQQLQPLRLTHTSRLLWQVNCEVIPKVVTNSCGYFGGSLPTS